MGLQEQWRRDKDDRHTRQGNFIFAFGGTFAIMVSVLFVVDFVPELRYEEQNTPTITVLSKTAEATALTASTSFTASNKETQPNTPKDVATTVAPGMPVRIQIERIGLDTPILNPASSDVNVLDRALLSGAVRYPESGLLGQNANMLLFGHSSYLPVVQNKAFKAFNELSKLTKGDSITVFAEDSIYIYNVTSVVLSKADDALVQFSATEPTLTLATCNSFGSKEDRWVVTARLVSTKKRQ
jgi:LPXTG-site transpeptidase (sortase) family protein